MAIISTKRLRFLRLFKYVDNNNDKRFDSWDKAATYLFDNYSEFAEKEISIRDIWFDNGWTVICDPEMVDSLDDKIMETLSQMFNSDVFSFLIQSTSGSYGFLNMRRTNKDIFSPQTDKLHTIKALI